ncbi:hypothetical protein NQZ68_013119 [Dissostichus eleginoides]|nr:hypothetical protein NQZ68_013119 [Dissostichus eleginoides]
MTGDQLIKMADHPRSSRPKRRDPRAKGRPSRPPSPPQAGSNSRSGSFPGDGLRVTSPLSLCGEPRRVYSPVCPICTTVMLLSSLASPPVVPSAPSAALWHCYFGGRGLKSLIILNPRQ